VLLDNADRGRSLVRRTAPLLRVRDQSCHCGCHTTLENALITAPDRRDPAVLARLDAVAGRVLGRR
jgi:5'-methylthioadenosine phosphorylase